MHALMWPMCRYPDGSGANRRTTLPGMALGREASTVPALFFSALEALFCGEESIRDPMNSQGIKTSRGRILEL